MPNKVYIAEETAKTWAASGGDYTMTLQGISADGVRVGAQGDLGASPRADQYSFKLVIGGFSSAPTVGETCDLYLSFSDGTNQDGSVGTSDAAGSTDDLPNLLFLGAASVQTTTASDELVISGVCQITQRYVSPVIHNNTAVALAIGGANHKFILTPVPPEVQ